MEGTDRRWLSGAGGLEEYGGHIRLVHIPQNFVYWRGAIWRSERPWEGRVKLLVYLQVSGSSEAEPLCAAYTGFSFS